MMKRHNNGISEEHIVAYLDGELNVNGEMREALSDAELKHVAQEYAVLKKIFARTASESRFLLGKSSDSRTLAYLQNVLRGNKGIRMADADAVSLSQQTLPGRTKAFWLKRSAIGFALTLFLGALWFTFKPSDNIPNVADNGVRQQMHSAPSAVPAAPESNVTHQPTAAPEVILNSAPSPVVKRSSTKQPVPKTEVAITPEKPANIVANQQEEQPADIMISRRYAKLMKNVRIVEVTQQDKM